MKFAVPVEHDRLCFQLSKRIPYAVGDNVAVPVRALLGRHNLTPSDVGHWVVHSGGAAVIDGVLRNLDLPHDALRHTTSVLRDYGNISSGSFLVSLERLLLEHQSSAEQLPTPPTPLLQRDQYIVFIAMGPGATIEVGLGKLE
jgi:3,5-dihydroxyphenylacetyl-CoA synthase